ncbi:MAG: glycoside hydrolase family 13 protein [Alicyclobacillus sp.]|nr:glycoside hydrolase family 13 protein [Alicyclobacillus sp.]
MKKRESRKRWGRAMWGVGIAGCAVAALGAPSDHAAARPKFDASALFSDTTPQFVSPAEPAIGQPFRISLRAGKGQVASASVVLGGITYPMHKSGGDSWFDKFTANIPGLKYPVSYYFQVHTAGGKTMYYAQTGANPNVPSMADTFTVVPGYQTPAWAQGAVFYQIFPDRFYNGDPSNDDVTNEFMYDGYPDVHVNNWSKVPDPTPYSAGGNRTREFYGGDLQGIIDKLPYLKGLGIQALYLNPVFVAPSNHKYDTQDFAHVDPHLGKIVHDGGKLVNPKLGMAANAQATKYIERTEDPANLKASDAVLQQLIAKAHHLGIRVVLDGVFEDTGSFNKWFDMEHLYPNQAPGGPGAYEAKNSPFHNYYSFSSSEWPNNNSYDTWMGVSTLPKLNYEQSPQLVKTIDNLARKWVSAPYRADGWRLDSAASLGYSQNYNLYFWDQFRKVVKAANPNALIVAEWYDDPSLYFDGKGFDSIQNYTAFLSPVSYLFTGLNEHSDQPDPSLKGNVPAFLTTMKSALTSFPFQAEYTAMNALDNHDVSRFLTRTNGQVGSDDMGNTPAQANQNTHPNVLEEGVLLDMTWPGDPTVYYGDEAGLAGWTDPDSRRTFPWGHENQALETYYHNIIHVHTMTSCFRTGSLVVFPQSKGHLLAFGRFDDKTAAVTVLNLGNAPVKVTLPVWQLDTPAGTNWQATVRIDEGGAASVPPGKHLALLVQQQTSLTVSVPAHGGLLLTCNKH